MNGEKIEIKLAEGQKELIIRTGDAEEIKRPNEIKVADATIKAPADFYEKRKSLSLTEEQFIDKNKAIVTVKTTDTSWIIILDTDPKCSTGQKNTITGLLSLSSGLEASKVYYGKGEPKLVNKVELIKFLKFNPQLFPDSEKRLDLIQKLSSLEVSYHGGSKDEADDRGNKERAFKKVVETTLPSQIKMKIPVFSGFEPADFFVDIGIDHAENSIKFWLECPSLVQYIKDKAKEILTEQVDRFGGEVLIIQFEV